MTMRLMTAHHHPITIQEPQEGEVGHLGDKDRQGIPKKVQPIRILQQLQAQFTTHKMDILRISLLHHRREDISVSACEQYLVVLQFPAPTTFKTIYILKPWHYFLQCEEIGLIFQLRQVPIHMFRLHRPDKHISRRHRQVMLRHRQAWAILL